MTYDNNNCNNRYNFFQTIHLCNTVLKPNVHRHILEMVNIIVFRLTQWSLQHSFCKTGKLWSNTQLLPEIEKNVRSFLTFKTERRYAYRAVTVL